jgi:hypothetical protein
MRLVTTRALAGRRGMNDRACEITPLVTASTQLSFRACQNRRVIGAVGVVAHGALIDVRMGVILAQAELRLVVAVQAKLRFVLLKSERADESVGPMTGGAIACRQGGVGMAHNDIDFLVTALARTLLVVAVESGAFSQLSHGGRGQQIEAEQQPRRKGDEPGTGVCAVSHCQ